MNKTYLSENEAEYLKETGQNITKFRKELGLTQTELANKIDAQQQAIASYEIGRRRIPLFILARIAEALHLKVTELLPIKDKPNKRGPAPKAVQYIEKIMTLPESKQKTILNSLEMMIDSAGK